MAMNSSLTEFPRFPGEVPPTEEATLALGEEEVAMVRDMHLLVKAEIKRVSKEIRQMCWRMRDKKEEMEDMGLDESCAEKFLKEELQHCSQYSRQLSDFKWCLVTKERDLMKQMSWLGIQPHDVKFSGEIARLYWDADRDAWVVEQEVENDRT